MNILRPADIENEIRTALSEYFTTYVRPLPANFSVPSLLIAEAGGNTKSTIDTFTVRIDARAETDAEACDLLRTALGALEEIAQQQTGKLRNVSINSLASWGNDPARPDLKLCTATVLVTAHREACEIQNES